MHNYFIFYKNGFYAIVEAFFVCFCRAFLMKNKICSRNPHPNDLLHLFIARIFHCILLWVIVLACGVVIVTATLIRMEISLDRLLLNASHYLWPHNVGPDLRVNLFA